VGYFQPDRLALPDPIEHAVVLGPVKAKPHGGA
jgi:hypothetical protein